MNGGKNEKNKEEELKEIDVLPPPTFDENSYNFISIEDAVYSIQQEIIDEVLESVNSFCLTVTNDGIKHKSKLYSLDTDELWNEINHENTVVFIQFEDNLIFENYIKYVSNRPSNFNFFSDYKSNIIELSKKIGEIHRKAKIKLCD